MLSSSCDLYSNFNCILFPCTRHFDLEKQVFAEEKRKQ